jgi:hypothetical protein
MVAIGSEGSGPLKDSYFLLAKNTRIRMLFLYYPEKILGGKPSHAFWERLQQ